MITAHRFVKNINAKARIEAIADQNRILRSRINIKFFIEKEWGFKAPQFNSFTIKFNIFSHRFPYKK